MALLHEAGDGCCTTHMVKAATNRMITNITHEFAWFMTRHGITVDDMAEIMETDAAVVRGYLHVTEQTRLRVLAWLTTALQATQDVVLLNNPERVSASRAMELFVEHVGERVVFGTSELVWQGVVGTLSSPSMQVGINDVSTLFPEEGSRESEPVMVAIPAIVMLEQSDEACVISWKDDSGAGFFMRLPHDTPEPTDDTDVT